LNVYTSPHVRIKEKKNHPPQKAQGKEGEKSQVSVGRKKRVVRNAPKGSRGYIKKGRGNVRWKESREKEGAKATENLVFGKVKTRKQARRPSRLGETIRGHERKNNGWRGKGKRDERGCSPNVYKRTGGRVPKRLAKKNYSGSL